MQTQQQRLDSIEQNRKVALVTGSTSGIGKAIAEKLLAEQFFVILHSNSSSESGLKLQEQHPNSCYFQADLADANHLHDMTKIINDRAPRLNALINCAAISQTIAHNDLQAATVDIWQNTFAVNLFAPWQLITQLQPLLNKTASKEETASIINISSHAGVRPKGASVPYSVSKAALNQMTKLLAKALAPNIRVNAIAPGLTATPMTEHWQDAHTLWQQRSPMGRQAQPEEIADLAWALIKNTYVTGEIITLDGGLGLT